MSRYKICVIGYLVNPDTLPFFMSLIINIHERNTFNVDSRYIRLQPLGYLGEYLMCGLHPLGGVCYLNRRPNKSADDVRSIPLDVSGGCLVASSVQTTLSRFQEASQAFVTECKPFLDTHFFSRFRVQ